MPHKTTKLMLSALAMLCVSASAGNGFAHTPEEVAQHCARRVNQIGDRCTNAVADTTLECVREINHLLDEGEVEAARRVARACIEDIQHIVDVCMEAIEQVCVRCINVLLDDFGAEELAARVRNFCGDALEDLARLERRAINLIRDQFA